MAEANKQQILTQQKVSYEQAKHEFETKKMEIENAMKVQNMELEFNYNMQLEQVRANVKTQKEKEIENRKDERTRIQATQQSQLIDQRKNDLLPTDFEENQQPPLLGEI